MTLIRFLATMECIYIKYVNYRIIITQVGSSCNVQNTFIFIIVFKLKYVKTVTRNKRKKIEIIDTFCAAKIQFKKGFSLPHFSNRLKSMKLKVNQSKII